MKKTVLQSLLSLAVLAMHLTLNAQTFSWFQQFRTDGKAVYSDGSHVWRIGYFSNSTTIGTTTLVSNGNYDILVTKSDLNGDVVWAKSFGGPKEERGSALCVDAEGNVYITGFYMEEGIIGSDTLTSDANYWQSNGYLAKLNASGTLQWTMPVKCTKDCQGVSLAYDSADDNVYLLASFVDTITVGTHVFTGQYYPNSCLAKINPSGDVVWANSFPQYEPRKLRMDAAGNIWFLYGVLGTTANSYVKKIDWSGNSLSTIHFPGVIINSFCLDNLSNVWGIGSLLGTATLGSSTLSSQNWDIVAVKADSGGNITFAKNYGGVNSEHGISICADPSNAIYVAGNKASTDTLGTFITSGSAFFMKLDNSGAQQWLGTIPGTVALGDQANDLCSDNAGNIFATGYFDAWVGNPITVNGTTYTEGGGFFAKLNAGGVNPPLGVEEVSLTKAIVYPNPARNQITIKFNQFNDNNTIAVYDLKGSLIKIQVISNSQETIDIRSLASGTYMLQINDAERVLFSKE